MHIFVFQPTLVKSYSIFIRRYDETNIRFNRKMSLLSAKHRFEQIPTTTKNCMQTPSEPKRQEENNSGGFFPPLFRVPHRFFQMESYLHFFRIYLIRFLCLHKLFLLPFYGKFIFLFFIFSFAVGFLAASLINFIIKSSSNNAANTTGDDTGEREKTPSSNAWNFYVW